MFQRETLMKRMSLVLSVLVLFFSLCLHALQVPHVHAHTHEEHHTHASDESPFPVLDELMHASDKKMAALILPLLMVYAYVVSLRMLACFHGVRTRVKRRHDTARGLFWRVRSPLRILSTRGIVHPKYFSA